MAAFLILMTRIAGPEAPSPREGRTSQMVPLGIQPNVVLSEILAIGTSAKTQQDRLARTEARIHQLEAELAQAADDLGWDKPQRDQHIAEIVRRLTDAMRLASTDQFFVLERAIQLLLKGQ